MEMGTPEHAAFLAELDARDAADKAEWQAYYDALPDGERVWYVQSKMIKHVWWNEYEERLDEDFVVEAWYVRAPTRGKAKVLFMRWLDLEFMDIEYCRLARRDETVKVYAIYPPEQYDDEFAQEYCEY